MRFVLQSTLFALLTFALPPLYAAEVSVSASIERGIYVSSNHPQCGTESPLSTTLRDREFQKNIGKLFGAKAQAVVAFTSQANSVVLQSGGDVARWLRAASGQNDFSSCSLMCVRTPRDATLSYMNLSRRTGGTGTYLGPYEVAVIDSLDFSGWRDVTMFRDEEDRTVVCATATNWSHDQSANKVLRVYYNEESAISDCGGFGRIEGQTWIASNPGDRWTTTWNLRAQTLDGRHPSGAAVSGSVQGICLPNRILFTTQQSDGNVCSCNLSRQDGNSADVTGGCTCPGAAVSVQGQLKR